MGTVVAVVLWFVVLTALCAFGIRHVLRGRGLRKLHRVREIAFFVLWWLLLGVWPLFAVLGTGEIGAVVGWFVLFLLIPYGLFVVVVWVWDQIQYRRDRRRDNGNGIPAWPQPHSWIGAAVLGFSAAVLTAFATVFIAMPWLILHNLETGFANADPNMTLAQAAARISFGQVPTEAGPWLLVLAFLVGGVVAVWWKASGYFAMKTRKELEVGLQRRLNTEREIGRDEGRAERRGEDHSEERDETDPDR